MFAFRLICIGIFCLHLSHSIAVGDGPVLFNRDIRPILSDHCFQCHGPDEARRQGDLRLDSATFAYQANASGEHAILPRNPEGSVLLHRVQSNDAGLKMPPPESGKVLKPHQISLLERWIREGAIYEGHWAFQPPTRPQVPVVQAHQRVTNPIDAFVLANLEARGFTMALEAEPETLLRRVTLDLTGLPPTPAELEVFLADRSANAYEHAVDRLLQSTRYGEHMAVQWLDLGRYADSNGYQIDSSRQQWRWRDWVIEAFNQNIPFDQFTVEQLAGDLLPEPTLWQKVATGFHRNHRLNGEGGIIAEEWRIETVADRVETTGLTWLGLTFNCCRCHDHKYDPITQREFYSFFSFFNNIEESGTLQGESRNTDPVIAVPTPDQTAEIARLREYIAAAEGKLALAMASVADRMQGWEPSMRDLLQHWKNPWVESSPSHVHSTQGTTLSRLEDGSFLASGKNPASDIYELQIPLEPGSWSGILLECFTDPSLPNQSLGRYSNGNFVLTRVEAELRAPSLADPIKANFQRVAADYSQAGWDIQATLGKIPGKGWAVDGPTRRETRRAMFLNNQVIQVPVEAMLVVRLVQETLGQHNIGRFRVSTTGQPLEAVGLDGAPLSESLQRILTTDSERRTEEEQQQLTTYYREEVDQAVREARRQVEEAKKQLTEYERNIPSVMVMKEIEKPRNAFVLMRGQYDQPGEQVYAGIPKVFLADPRSQPNNRLGLARWIVDRTNPLTARVWVNRAWERFMGVGIVKTTENFGSQADWPSNLELLDWLAVEFMEPTTIQSVGERSPQAWDMKAIHKLMVMSSAYRQSSSHQVSAMLKEQDPENRWLGRGPRFRLNAEVVRDQALAVSGLLVEKIGGPSVRPYMPEGVWDETSVYGDLRNYQHAKDDGLYRRTLYTVWKRTAGPPTQMLFDAPSRESCTVIRSKTNTPLQALSLLNEVTFVEAARKLGERMMREGGTTPSERLAFGFRLVTARKPLTQELAVLVKGWEEDRAHFSHDAVAVESLLKLGESKSSVVDMVELAAYTMAGNVLLNLDECITRE